MGDQGVDQRTGPVAGGRMDDQTGRLVDDDKMGVLECDIERDILAKRDRRFGLGQIDHDAIARVDPVVGLDYRGAADGDVTRLDQGLEPVSAEFPHGGGEIGIEPLTCLIGGHGRGLAAFRPARPG